ncbi:MAG: DNA polymerase III subunit gamma/tau [Acidobacteriota bacterium]
MSYLVIARKWRPQTFEEVVGQPHVTRTLQNGVRTKRIAHAYLFTGARGVGKTSIARILAKTLNCERDLSPIPCNVCSNCREITQGNSVDVLEIDGASNRGIDSIRELRETVRYRPAKSRYKIYIIDEVHMLTPEAFNALLKTLEEPPEHVLFIFATTEPHKIPATILSRCQRLDFRRIPTEALVKHLKNICERENAPISDVVLYAVAREADGSMRDAQSLLEQLLAFSGDGLSNEEILDILGVVDRRSVHRMGSAIIDGDVRGCLDVVEDLHRRGIDSRRFCQQLCDYFRNLLFLALDEGRGESRLDLPAEELDLLRAEAGKTSSETLHLYFQALMKGEIEIRKSSLPRIALEMLVLRLAQLPRVETLERILDTLSGLEAKLSGLPAAPATDARPPERRGGGSVESSPVGGGSAPPRAMEDRRSYHEKGPPPPPVGTQPVGGAEEIPGLWGPFCRWLGEADPILGAKLNGRRALPGDNGSLEIEVLEVYERSLGDSLPKLTEAAASFFGLRPAWVVRKRSAVKAEPAASQQAKPSKQASRRAVMENPIVMQALEILGGELMDIKPPRSDDPRRRGGG